MSYVITVSSHFFRKDWNDVWEYPETGSLIRLEKDVPSLSPFYFSWEKNYEPLNVMRVSRRLYWMGPIVTLLYLTFVYLGPRIMRYRKPFNLKRLLKYWNLFLAIFSTMGMLRIVPQLLYVIKKTGFENSLCIPPVWDYGSGASGLWTMLFVYSKFFELIDTLFIILRKKPLKFLHWYHHATVLLYTWNAFMVEQPPGIYFTAMNYTVHALMYYYYYLAAKLSKPPSWGYIVTITQITQMILGVLLTVFSPYLSVKYPFLAYSDIKMALKPIQVPGCYINSRNLLVSLAMYSTYFYLFADFFFKRYIYKQPNKSE